LLQASCSFQNPKTRKKHYYFRKDSSYLRLVEARKKIARQPETLLVMGRARVQSFKIRESLVGKKNIILASNDNRIESQDRNFSRFQRQQKYPNRSRFKINNTPPSGSDPSGNQQEAGTTTKPNL
jgi:hypothetical protein